MCEVKILNLRYNAELIEDSCLWFHEKWGIPISAYRDSMLYKSKEVPIWYVVINSNNKIIAGAGVIDNDFHLRKDLTPNLCALYVEEEFRNFGIAKKLIAVIKENLCNLGIEEIYLVTDHKNLYEKMGWNYLTNTIDDDGNSVRVYEIKTKKETSNVS